MKNLVSTLTRGTITTATSVVRHPIRTTSVVLGVAKGTAEAGIGLVRGRADSLVEEPAPEPAPEAARRGGGRARRDRARARARRTRGPAR